MGDSQSKTLIGGHEARRHLAVLWVFGALVLVVLVAAQSVFGAYRDKTADAWAWLVPTFLPTVMLVVGVLAAQAGGKVSLPATVDGFFYRLTFLASLVYVLFVAATILVAPLSRWTPLELMKLSNFWLSPVQSVVSACIAVFFVQRAGEETKAAESGG